MNSLMICSRAKNALKLNESENTGKKYILEGVFAELDVLNRNQRIYKKEEYLKHLQYLRNDIKKGEPLLGELDHPEDRFEVKLKEASHQVLDLWYDSAKNVVMGKIMLLNTPNGKLAQSMVDQGIPLHISSRAAGTVSSDNTVSIQQIYTYDLVCKPGFAGAVLHRVNESADACTYDDNIREFLTNSYKLESMNSAPQYGFLNEDMSVSEIKAPVVLRKEAKEIQINKQIEITDDMSKPLNETTNPDSTVGKPLNISGNGGAAALGIPVGDINTPNEAKESDDEKKDTKEVEKKEEKKACDKCGKEPCECKKANESEDKDSEEKEDSEDAKDKKDDAEEGDEKNSEDKKDSGVEIIEVEAEFEDDKKGEDDDMIKDVEAENGSDKKSEDKDKEDKKSDDKEDDETSEGKDEDKPLDKDDKDSKEAEQLNSAAKKDIEKHKEDIFKKLDDLKATIEKKSSEKKEAKCESIIMAQYPVSMMMNESDFAKFASLSESQKNKVVAYLQDNNFTTHQSINENWQNGIEYTPETPVWLKFAPSNYKALYEQASQTVKDHLATSAKYFVFESQHDINIFWENSGLVEQNAQRVLNESFVNALPKVAPVEQKTSLPYGNDFIKQVAEMASEYNRKY